jgi:hypothetical protein
MIKLSNLLKEIEVGIGIPKFKNNDELAQYLRENPSSKEELIDAIWNSEGDNTEEGWEDVLDGWYNADIEQYGNYTVDSEFWINNNDDRIDFSINPLKEDRYRYRDIIIHKTKFGPNIIYWRYIKNAIY